MKMLLKCNILQTRIIFSWISHTRNCCLISLRSSRICPNLQMEPNHLSNVSLLHTKAHHAICRKECCKHFFQTIAKNISIKESKLLFQNNNTVCTVQAARMSSVSKKIDGASENKFYPVYRFPHIVIVRGLSRLKIYQTAMTFVGLPPIGYFYSIGTISSQFFTSCIALTSLAALMLYVISGYSRQLIGMISLDREKKVVRVSHLTFWGKRRDIFYSVEDIIPLTDLSDNPTDIYVVFRTYKDTKKFYLTLRFGGIIDPEQFTNIMGDIKL